MKAVLLTLGLITLGLPSQGQVSVADNIEYYVTLSGDTVIVNLYSLKKEKLQFYNSEGKGKYILLDKISGYKFKKKEFSKVTQEMLDHVRGKTWLISKNDDSLSSHHYGISISALVSLLPVGPRGQFSISEQQFPYTDGSSEAYKNAFGGLAYLLPTLELVYYAKGKQLFSVGAGFRKSNLGKNTVPYEYWYTINTDHEQTYFKFNFERPIRKAWIRTKEKSKGVKYPWYGLGFSYNSKSLNYSLNSTGAYGTESKRSKEFRDISNLTLIQAYLGFYKQIGIIHFKYGVSFNLVSHASGKYDRSETYIHLIFPEDNFSTQFSGEYSKTSILGKYTINGVFLSSGIYIN